MVYLPPPHLSSASQPSYAEAYAKILAAHRRSPKTAASSVVILVAPDVDALCASKMLSDILKQDDVMYRIIPVAGHAELERIRDELATYADLHTLLMFNMGAILDLPSPEWFGDFPPTLTVHVIDSSRPQNLSSVFGAGENGDRIVIWDDGGVESLQEERKAWEVLTYAPEVDSDEDSDFDSDEDGTDEEDEDDDEDGASSASSPRKRRSSNDGGRRGKRRKLDQPNRISREEREQHEHRLIKYYRSGTWYGQSASGTMYILATVLERVDNDLLWLAILGLTYQYVTSRVSRDEYDKYQQIYNDEVARLNPAPPPTLGDELKAQSPDDNAVYSTEEFRFIMFRHWNLYDAMYHSSYVASKLGIWKERGRKRLTGLLAKMGFSIPETQQPYPHMAKDLKASLREKLDQLAPEYSLVELSYPSFTRCYGYRGQPLSAGDAVEALSALLDIAGGTRIEIEEEGARNGGDWFGGGRVWDAGKEGRHRDDDRENVPPGALANMVKTQVQGMNKGEGEGEDVEWWVKNFWSSFDALNDIERQKDAIRLSMALHRAIIRQGSSIIDRQEIKTMRGHRVVLITQGPDLQLFVHPGVLNRLALWLVEALRDRVDPTTPAYSRSKRKSLPVVVACLNERTNTFIVVGVTGAADFDDVRKNEFGLAFLDAKERCNARTRHGTFDTSVLEINRDDLKVFLETLCESRERF
ncbi:CDC45-like protein [Epithele typhae]|uniref:CDC45-like protein n=1 Tax=Epithele typhae TaxID=378194 RepID=UPI002008A58D|nr:CDC45-like protein [Epithele typhae]KAH9945982.1 CDC45-like protein [Epithele typhae]